MQGKSRLRLSKVLNQYDITQRRSIPYRPTMRFSRPIFPAPPLSRIRARQSVFEFIRDAAVIVLRNKLMDLLTLYRMKTLCITDDKAQYDDPYHVFDWSIDEFYTRCQMKNTFYVDLMLFEVPEKCLDVIKVSSEIDQIKKYIAYIFQNETPCNRSSFSIEGNFLGPLNSLYELLTIETYLKSEIERHSKRRKRNIFQLQYFDNAINIKKEMIRVDLERRLVDIQLTNPAEYRYLMKWVEAKREQQELVAHTEEVDYFERIQHQIYLKELSQLTTRSVLDATYTTIEVIKSKIHQMSARYDKDYEEIDNKLVYLQKKIDNFVSERRFLTFEIQRFHTEIEEQRLRDEELARKKAEEEAAKKAAKGLKKGKRKGKGGGKGEGKEKGAAKKKKK